MRKFILMDPEEVKALKTARDINNQEYKIVNPRLNAMARLNREMEGELDDANKSEDEQAKSYVQAFQDFLTFKNQYAKSVSKQVPESAEEKSPKIEEGISSSDIAKTVPKNLRTKAERLAELLKASGSVTWDERNRLIVDGKPVEGTNIIDLINDALRRRKTFQPHGRSAFADKLRNMNAPRELVGNADYWVRSSTESTSGEESEYASPLRMPVKEKKGLESPRRSRSREVGKKTRKTDWRKNRPSLADIKWSKDINN